MVNKYSLRWFRSRALASIKRIGSNSWDFSVSLLLYIPQAAEAYKTIQENKTSYNELITKPETKFISEIVGEIVKELPRNFYYVDLGPGTEHKEKLFFQAAQSQGKNFVYFPVDIDGRALDSADNFARAHGIKVKPILAPFEECRDYLPNDDVYRFVSLGLTFVNYHIQDILQLLKGIVGMPGSAFINTQIRERIDIEKIRKLYLEQVEPMVAPKVDLFGLNFLEDIESVEVNNGIETWCKIKNPSRSLINMGVKSGDQLLAFQSRRYGLDEVKREIVKVFSNYSVFDNGSSFVAFLLKNGK